MLEDALRPMHPTSHHPRRSGTTRATLLLACAGTAAAAVLGLLMVRDGDARAAAPVVGPAPETALGAPSPVEDGGAELVAAEVLPEAETTPVPAIALAPAEGEAAVAAAGGEDTLDLAATEKKVEGPALRYLKGEGKPQKYARGEVRAESRRRLEEQRTKDAERAAATGEVRTSPATKKDDPTRAKFERKRRRDAPSGG